MTATAGITSAITAPLAAAYVANGCLGWDGNLKSWNFRIVWMLVLALGVVFSSLGISPIEIIQFAQIANGIALPIVVGIILWIMNRKAVLGAHVNSGFHNLCGLIIFAVTIMLGIRALILVFGL